MVVGAEGGGGVGLAAVGVGLGAGGATFEGLPSSRRSCGARWRSVGVVAHYFPEGLVTNSILYC